MMKHSAAHDSPLSTLDLADWLLGSRFDALPRSSSRAEDSFELGDSLRLCWWSSGASGRRPKGYPTARRPRAC